MKKIIFILVTFIALIPGCSNFDITYPDFEYTSGYFPYQYPVRTLVLGDYVYDNSNDNAHKFVIYAAMGGVYENNKDRVFDIEVDNSLCDDIFFSETEKAIKALPENYYSISSNQIIIPKGKVNGGVEIQLTEEFFSDPDAISNTYVVPLRLLSSNDVDTILEGNGPSSADPRIPSQWTVSPKNFTMYGIKYINEYHGTYFHYGENHVTDNSGTVIEENQYSEKFIENNPVVNLITKKRHQVSLNTFLISSLFTVDVELLLTFDGDNCTISSAGPSPYIISGTGEFRSKAFKWGNKERDGVELNYSISNGTYTYQAKDFLIIRDRDIVMELYNPTL